MSKHTWIPLLIVFAVGLYFGSLIPKTEVRNINSPDTLKVFTSIDTNKVIQKYLINQRGKIARYNIDSKGNWVLREPDIKWKPSDTVYVPIQDSMGIANDVPVATFDSTMAFTDIDIKTGDTLSIGWIKLYIRYAYAPFNQWRLSMVRNTNYYNRKTTITEVQYELVPDPSARNFFQRFDYGPLAGIGFTGNKQFDYFVGIGIFYGLR